MIVMQQTSTVATLHKGTRGVALPDPCNDVVSVMSPHTRRGSLRAEHSSRDPWFSESGGELLDPRYPATHRIRGSMGPRDEREDDNCVAQPIHALCVIPGKREPRRALQRTACDLARDPGPRVSCGSRQCGPGSRLSRHGGAMLTAVRLACSHRGQRLQSLNLRPRTGRAVAAEPRSARAEPGSSHIDMTHMICRL